MSEQAKDDQSVDHGQPGADSGQADDGNAGVSIADDLLKKAKGQAYSHGYSEARSKLLSELGLESVDQLRERLDSLSQIEQEKQATELAEKEEKQQLAARLKETEKTMKALEKDRASLDALREQVLTERLRNAALSGSVIPTAIDLLIPVMKRKVKWNEDFSDITIDDHDDVSGLIDELKKTHHYLFESKARQGTGATNAPTNRREEYVPSYSSLEERLK